MSCSGEVVAARITLHHTNAWILAAPPAAAGKNEDHLSFVRALSAADFGAKLNGDAVEEL